MATPLGTKDIADLWQAISDARADRGDITEAARALVSVEAYKNRPRPTHHDHGMTSRSLEQGRW